VEDLKPLYPKIVDFSPEAIRIKNPLFPDFENKNCLHVSLAKGVSEFGSVLEKRNQSFEKGSQSVHWRQCQNNY
jgi:hypothetical protein